MKPSARHNGNTTPEYAFIAILVLIGCIAVFYAIGDGLVGQMSGLKQDMRRSIARSNMVQQAREGKINFTTASGQSYSLDGSAASGANGENGAVTTGANGDVIVYINTGDPNDPYTRIVLTQEEANMMIGLSNQTFKMADIMSKIEMMVAQSNGDSERFRSLSVSYNGSIYKAQDLVSMLDWGGEMKTFNDMRKQLLNKSGLDPIAREYVSFISSDVMRRTTNLRNSANDALWSDIDPGKVNGMKSAYNTSQAGVDICNKANQKNNGKRCGTTQPKDDDD